MGCHACGLINCFAASPHCHSKCTARFHVCGPSDNINGCSSCGRLCHVNNADQRCAFYQKDRGALQWSTTDNDRMDTLAGTGCTVPHRTQVSWKFTGTTIGRRQQIEVNNHMYYVGHGDSGSEADGERNNCLIDSLRQCIGVPCSRVAVRNDLLVRHPFDEGRARVTADSYLDVAEHWTSILSSIFRHHTAVSPVSASLAD